MARLGIFEDINTFIMDAYNDSFVDAALRNRRQIEIAVQKRFKEFFREMHGFIGSDVTPPPLKTGWLPLDPFWAKRKGLRTGNRFYHGLTGRFSSTIARKDPVKAYGAPSVFIELARGGSFDTGTGRFRNPKGQFSRAIDVGLRVGIISFPKVDDEGDLISVFSGRTAQILRANEEFSDGQQDFGRPFLGPMYNYYVERVLPETFLKEATR